MTMGFETLSIAIDAHVATLTLARPERLNAISGAMNRELPQAWAALERDPNVRVVIVTGAGDKAFCTGADLQDLPIDPDPEAAQKLSSIRWTGRQNGVTKPVIAAVNGLTIGGGLHFVADADIVLAAEGAVFFDSHVAVGLVAALEPITLLARMPIGAVMKLALTGGAERCSAAEALRVGLVDEVLPLSELPARAQALASTIAQHSPTAVARTRAAIWAAKELPLEAALERGWQHIQRQNDHPDLAEGIRAFREKRPPRWLPRKPGDLA